MLKALYQGGIGGIIVFLLLLGLLVFPFVWFPSDSTETFQFLFGPRFELSFVLNLTLSIIFILLEAIIMHTVLERTRFFKERNTLFLYLFLICQCMFGGFVHHLNEHGSILLLIIVLNKILKVPYEEPSAQSLNLSLGLIWGLAIFLQPYLWPFTLLLIVFVYRVKSIQTINVFQLVFSQITVIFLFSGLYYITNHFSFNLHLLNLNQWQMITPSPSSFPTLYIAFSSVVIILIGLKNLFFSGSVTQTTKATLSLFTILMVGLLLLKLIYPHHFRILYFISIPFAFLITRSLKSFNRAWLAESLLITILFSFICLNYFHFFEIV